MCFKNTFITFNIVLEIYSFLFLYFFVFPSVFNYLITYWQSFYRNNILFCVSSYFNFCVLRAAFVLIKTNTHEHKIETSNVNLRKPRTRTRIEWKTAKFAFFLLLVSFLIHFFLSWSRETFCCCCCSKMCEIKTDIKKKKSFLF